MAPPRYLPSDSTLAKWVEEGLTARQIAERVERETGYRVARSTVAAALSRAGLTNQVRWSDFIPWSPVRADHANRYPAVMLRYAARRQNGLEISPDANKRLDAWIAKLKENNAVVTYSYESDEGFYYVPARPGIDTGLIRDPNVK